MNLDVSAVQLDDLLHDCQAQPGAASGARLSRVAALVTDATGQRFSTFRSGGKERRGGG